MSRHPRLRAIDDQKEAALHAHWRTFSLWCPGPLQRVYRRMHLADDAYELARRRMAILTAIAWLPLFLLSAIDQRVSRGVEIPFLLDLDLQARLLIALPLLVAGEVIVHRRMPLLVRQFVDRRIVVGASREGFDAAVDGALALSQSVIVEILLVVCVYTVGELAGGSIASLSGSTWYGQTANGSTALTSAGWWYVAVSRPLFQYIALRWYFRFFVWNRLLWKVSRLRLHLLSTHPDRRAGLGFVFSLNDAFAPFLFAHGAMLAGRVGNGVIHGGFTLRHYELELVVVPIMAILFVLAPELTFTPTLWRTKRKGLRDYGAFAQRYVREFDRKWLGQGSVGEPLLGTSDIQSLADLGNSFEIVQRLRLLPTKETILNMALITLLPLAPLPLTVVSGRVLLERLVKVML